MNNQEKLIQNNSLPYILTIFGEEEYLIEEFYNELSNKFITKENEFDTEFFDGENIDQKTLVDSLNSYPFISDYRIVVCKNFDSLFPQTKSKKNKDFNLFSKYIENPLPTTKLIILTDYEKLNGITLPKNSSKKDKTISGLKFPYNLLLSKFDYIEFPKIWESDFPKYIVNLLKTLGRTIEQSALELLVTQTNPSIREIRNEIDKLLVYTDNKLFITYDDVVSITGVSRNYNVFELQKAIGKRDIDKAIEIIINILDNDKQEVLILTILTRYFIVLMKLYELQFTETDKYILASKIGVNAFFLNDYKNSLNLYSIKEIENAIILISETDLKLKSTSINGIVLIENLLVNILVNRK